GFTLRRGGGLVVLRRMADAEAVPSSRKHERTKKPGEAAVALVSRVGRLPALASPPASDPRVSCFRDEIPRPEGRASRPVSYRLLAVFRPMIRRLTAGAPSPIDDDAYHPARLFCTRTLRNSMWPSRMDSPLLFSAAFVSSALARLAI